MIKNWRFTSDVTLIISNTGKGNEVYVASPEKKQYEVAVSKLAKNNYTMVTVENSDFELKFRSDDGPAIYLKTNQVPELGWAKVMNFNNQSIWNIFSQCSMNSGNFKDKFNAAFSEDDIKTVTFISSSMCEYGNCINEMTRRLNCEIGKKTKSLKPGHRYDILKETRYYLCSVVSRKSSKCCSDFQDDATTAATKAYIYVNEINDKDSTVSEILKNRKFGSGPYDLKIAISESSSWIDSGEKLKNDFTGNIKDYWEDIIENTSKSYNYKVKDSEYYTYYKYLKEILEVLSCQSLSDLTYTMNKSTLDKITNIISNVLEYDLLMCWKLRNRDQDLELREDNTVEKNTKALEKIFYSSIKDGNINKFSYYRGLISYLGIDLTKMATLMISTFSESKLNYSFEDYIKYRFFWKNKKFLYPTKSVLDFSVNRLNSDCIESVKNIFSGIDLSSCICDLYNYANSNYGIGVSEYIVNKSSSGDSIVYCCITLEDLLKFKKGTSGVSENLKNEIKNNKFSSIIINCKQTDILE